ncbi:hypothetical protein [Flavobacterium hungaricum]|uniref:Lipocalin-like domain-containing protein n=1 Tax=Flavobacterium hungaricum TaxID=2082725 RepID=A0ABR9TEF2_9FLAO|nr:hypothetical protein [Flavobacterium hungaricum]MBE8723720.1 hypothetical protein [Flavobacterium hungaricum]
MRKSIFIFGLLFMIILGFSQKKTDEKTKVDSVDKTVLEKKESGIKTYDSKLVGCWRGSEVGQQQEGISKYWVSCRFEDGRSTLLFIMIDKKGKVTQETENGKWWVENGKYYELHNYDGVIDVYNYQATDETVDFKSVELMGKKDSSYKFTDYRIQED